MSITLSLSKDSVHDLFGMINLEASPASTSDYVQVNAQEEWENFLTLIKK